MLMLPFHMPLFPSSFHFLSVNSLKSSVHVLTHVHGTKYTVMMMTIIVIMILRIIIPLIIRQIDCIETWNTDYQVTRRRKAQ